MSQESSKWLNNNTLIGFTEKRGHAWHYRADDQGIEPNHYPAAIPVADVERRLFAWDALEQPLYIETPGIFGDGGFTVIEDRKAIVRSDTRTVLGIFKDGYQPHQYRQWLVQNVASILDDDLGIGSAGLLKGGAQAWVSVEVPETVTTPEGVSFRPHLLAYTSFDGSLATAYGRKNQLVVCDNTLAIARGEKGQTYKLKHTRNSQVRIGDARAALAIVHTMADDFAAEVAELCAWTVTNAQWDALLDAVVPVPAVKGRAQTVAGNKQDELRKLYNHDQRVAPWRGTAFGAVQAFNTYDHHIGTVRNVEHRAERNLARAISGEQDTADALVLSTLAELCGVG